MIDKRIKWSIKQINGGNCFDMTVKFKILPYKTINTNNKSLIHVKFQIPWYTATGTRTVWAKVENLCLDKESDEYHCERLAEYHTIAGDYTIQM